MTDDGVVASNKDPKRSAAEIRQYSHHKNVFFENAPGHPSVRAK